MIETTTKDLIINLARILDTERSDRLRSVEDIKVGIIKTPPQFPAIAVVPINRRVDSATNGLLNILHTVRLDVYTKKMDTASSFNQGVGIINTLKQILAPSYPESGYLVKQDLEDGLFDTTASSTVVDERFTDIVDYNNTIVHYAMLLLEFYGQRTTYQTGYDVEAAAELRETPPKELMEVVLDTLKNYKDDKLKKVASFKSAALPPQPQFPCVYVTTDAVTPLRVLTSAEVDEHDIKIIVLNKMLDVKESLLDCMEIAETIFDIMNVNSYLGGRVIEYPQPSIDFGQMDFGDTMLYSSIVNLKLRALNAYAT